MSDAKEYQCGVCKRIAEGNPQGGFNTPTGTVIVCSGACLLEGMKHNTPTTFEAIARNQAKGNKPS